MLNTAIAEGLLCTLPPPPHVPGSFEFVSELWHASCCHVHANKIVASNLTSGYIFTIFFLLYQFRSGPSPPGRSRCWWRPRRGPPRSSVGIPTGGILLAGGEDTPRTGVRPRQARLGHTRVGVDQADTASCVPGDSGAAHPHLGHRYGRPAFQPVMSGVGAGCALLALAAVISRGPSCHGRPRRGQVDRHQVL